MLSLSLGGSISDVFWVQKEEKKRSPPNWDTNVVLG